MVKTEDCFLSLVKDTEEAFFCFINAQIIIVLGVLC